MDKGLLAQALTKFLTGLILLGLLIFLPAGSMGYWQGWLLMGVLFVPITIAGIVLAVKSPDLLRKRLNTKEEDKDQKAVVAISGLLFIASFVIAGLNWRFEWIILPDWAVWTAAVIFLSFSGNASGAWLTDIIRDNARIYTCDNKAYKE